jgi:hypothetical protein
MAPLEGVVLKEAILREVLLEALVLREVFPEERAQEDHPRRVVVLEGAMLEVVET